MAIRSYRGRRPTVAPTAYVDPAAVVIGDVTIGEHSSLWPMVVARGDENRILIGSRTNIQDGVVLHTTHKGKYTPEGYGLQVGDGVTCGHRAVLHGCTIGDYCLIGMGAIVMDGAMLKPRVILGAGALVPPGKELEGGFLWVGAPAKKLRALSDTEVEMLGYWAEHYVALKDRYLKGGVARAD